MIAVDFIIILVIAAGVGLAGFAVGERQGRYAERIESAKRSVRMLPDGHAIPDFPLWQYDGVGAARTTLRGTTYRLSVEDDGTEFSLRLAQKYLGKFRTARVMNSTDRAEIEREFRAWWLQPLPEEQIA